MINRFKKFIVKKNSSFRYILTLVLLLIIPVTLSFVFLLFYSINESDEEFQTQFTSYVDTHVEDVENLIYNINNFMIDTITNNEDIKGIRSTDDSHQRNIYARSLQNELEKGRSTYGQGFSFYYWNSNISVSIFETSYSYTNSLEMSEYIEKLRDEEVAPDNSFDWEFVELENSEAYILQRFSVEGDYIYCWISLNILLNNTNANNNSVPVAFFDDEFNPITSSEEYINVDFKKSNELIRYNNEYFYLKSLDYSNTSIVFRNSALFDLGELYIPLVLLFFIMLITIAISIYVLSYYKNNIEKPLKKIENYIFDYDMTNEERKKSGFAEISNAAAAFDDLNNKLNELRINMYEEKLSHAKTELQFYQLQIKPHFFVNCYSILFAMAQKKDYVAIQNLCLKLSSYVRCHFVNCLDLVTLKSELTSVIDYLDIQNIRHRTNATLTDSIDEELLDCKIPHMLLMTFVENSIKHYKNLEKELLVEIIIEPLNTNDKEMIQIYIVDNGPGIEKEINYAYIENQEESPAYDESHIGLNNIHKRLSMLYGNNFKFTIKNNTEHTGTKVELLIPKNR